MKIKDIYLIVVIAIIGTWVASCSDHYALDRVRVEATDIAAKLDSAALPVHPNHFADMSFLAETAERELSITYRCTRQDYGVSIDSNGTIDTECPKIYGHGFSAPGRIIIDKGIVYEPIYPRYTPEYMVLYEFQIPFNTVLEAYASSKGKSIRDFKFYQKIHLSDEANNPGPYMHSHYFGCNAIDGHGKSPYYFYTLAADTLEVIARFEHGDGSSSTLQRYDYTVAEPIDISEADGIFEAETEMQEYLLNEFERTFGERYGDILISDLRDGLVRLNEMRMYGNPLYHDHDHVHDR